MIAKTPIAILSFNRPHYLEQTLRSLAAQSAESLTGREIHLFQDGMFNKLSKQTHATEKAVLSNIASFSTLFPSGYIHTQEENPGIALHFDFVERYLFESRGFEAAIFLEDDMALSPLYLTVLDKMISIAMTNESVGYVAAYGDWRATLTEQMKYLSKLVTMENKWGFALTKRQWLRQKPFVEEYLSIVSETDYTMRDDDRINDWFVSTGYLPAGTSQDGAKDVAMYSSGATKLMTFCCYGRYIGQQGLHSSEKLCESLGFSKTQLCPVHADHFDWPSRAEMTRHVERQLRVLSRNATLAKCVSFLGH